MQQLFKRNRRCDLVSQPAFWPAISLGGMTLFGLMHLIGSILSPRIDGRLKEIGFWLRSVEYTAWFLAYVWLVPIIGYLLATLVFMLLMALSLAYSASFVGGSFSVVCLMLLSIPEQYQDRD